MYKFTDVSEEHIATLFSVEEEATQDIRKKQQFKSHNKKKKWNTTIGKLKHCICWN
jgi:hypothetical protein